MNFRRTLAVIGAVHLLIVLCFFWWYHQAGDQSANLATKPAPTSVSAVSSQPQRSPDGATASRREESLADRLNAPDSTIRSDLEIVTQVLESYRTNFPSLGNPVGENAEITAAITGKNPARAALIARDHRAINAQGELCDRWGSPFFFHQLSGSAMEVRSAGPDRKLWTADDVTMTP